MRRVIVLFAGCLFSLLNFVISVQASFQNKPNTLIKTGVEYRIEPNQKIKLRVTEIPRAYPWVERQADGLVELPKIGSDIIAETIDDVVINDDAGVSRMIKSGTRFYARLVSVDSAKSFSRNGGVKLSFYQVELADPQRIIVGESKKSLDSLAGLKSTKILPNEQAIDLTGNEVEFDSTQANSVLASTGQSLINAGAYTVGGAIVAPLAIVQSLKIFGMAAVTNPYVLGGAAAVGGGIGLVYGIKKKGKSFIIEPGTELEVNLDEAWVLAENLPEALPELTNSTTVYSKDFDLEILGVKKTKDAFANRGLEVSLNYDNRTGEELRYLSFQLVDSMGKEYTPTPDSISLDSSGVLPQQANLNLFFSTDFAGTAHQLKVLRLHDQKPMAVANVVLK